MARNTVSKGNILKDISASFKGLPTWINIWMVLLLMPINLASVLFKGEPFGMEIALLANLGLILNIPVVIWDRGFSKLMSLMHLVPWTLLIILIITQRPESTSTYNMYLWALVIINLISLAFDYPDSLKWLKGDRAPAGKSN